MKSNRKPTLEIESITGEGTLILVASKPPTRRNRYGKYRVAGIKPSHKN